DVTLIKGGMPSQYGGRLSAVLDISMKDGNSQKFQVDGGIGVIASRITVQGPIKKDKCSFIISARRTYIDVFTKPFFKYIKPGSEFAGTSYYFYDLNAKINYRFSDKDRLFLSGYFGRDVFKFTDADGGFTTDIKWGNATGCLRWNHVFNSKLFSNLSVIYSNYDFSFGAQQDDFELTLRSGIRDWNFKYDLNYFPNPRHNVKAGVNYIFHTFIPTSVSAKQGDTEFDLGKITKLYSHEAAAYIGDDWEITEKLKVNVGLRFGYFAQVGPFTRYTKNFIGQPADTVNYAPGKKVVDYNGLEPRFSIRYSFTKSFSVKASYTHNYQYVHLASISSVSLPTDVWMPCTDVIKPQISDQYALGVFKNFMDNTFETSIECYYKTMANQIDYKEGAQPSDNVSDNPDNAFTFGKGWAYGAEFFLKKRTGKFTGWIGYTLSWTWRQFKDINYGMPYLAKYDRRHDASLVLTYDHSKKWNFGLVWVFSTGTRGTLPNGFFIYEGSLSNDYGLRNSYQFPSYNRMDISITLTPDKEKHIARRKTRMERRYTNRGKDVTTIVLPKNWARDYQGSWTLSVFNVYNRYNPYFIYYTRSGDFLSGNLTVSAKQVSLFPILPSLTWNFKF
ncbi:MAG: TonB-dependent receptor plug domain-containing protein, partial [Bacteroidia bacterium]